MTLANGTSGGLESPARFAKAIARLASRSMRTCCSFAAADCLACALRCASSLRRDEAAYWALRSLCAGQGSAGRPGCCWWHGRNRYRARSRGYRESDAEQLGNAGSPACHVGTQYPQLEFCKRGGWLCPATGRLVAYSLVLQPNFCTPGRCQRVRNMDEHRV